MDTKKLLVISDSHEHVDKLKIALEWGKDNNIGDLVFLGDGLKYLESTCNKISYTPNQHVVRGNHDHLGNVPNKKTLKFGGHCFFLCHGDDKLYKDNYSELCKAAKEADADIVLCGHHHDFKKIELDDLLIIKVGSVGAEYQNTTGSFVVIECPPDKGIVVNLCVIEDGKIVHSIQ